MGKCELAERTARSRARSHVTCLAHSCAPPHHRPLPLLPLPPPAQCRPYNLAAVKHIRDLDPSDIDKLVCIKGMVTRTSAIIPNLR